MYSQQDISAQVLDLVTRRFKVYLHALYYEDGPTKVDPFTPSQSSPLLAAVELLVAIANGEYKYEQEIEREDDFIGKVRDALRLVTTLFHGTAYNPYPKTIPEEWWTKEQIGQVCALVSLWLEPGEWITFTEAASILFPHLAPHAGRLRIKRLTLRGAIPVIIDPREAYEARARRVRRTEVQEASWGATDLA
jgi:hypothetical protein